MRQGVFWFSQFRLLVSFLTLYALVRVAQQVNFGWRTFANFAVPSDVLVTIAVRTGELVFLVIAWGLEYFSIVAWLSRLAAAPIDAAIAAAPDGSRPSIDGTLWCRGLTIFSDKNRDA